MNYPTFRTAEKYQEFIRKGGTFYDVVKVEGVVFTQDEYDFDGLIVSYGNKRKGLGMDIGTGNRYLSSADARVEIFSTNCFLDGKTYID